MMTRRSFLKRLSGAIAATALSVDLLLATTPKVDLEEYREALALTCEKYMDAVTSQIFKKNPLFSALKSHAPVPAGETIMLDMVYREG
jgi:hypothetical protein